MRLNHYLTDQEADTFKKLSITVTKKKNEQNQELVKKIDDLFECNILDCLKKSNKKLKRFVNEGFFSVIESGNPFKTKKIKNKRKSENLKLELFELNDLLGEIKSKIDLNNSK